MKEIFLTKSDKELFNIWSREATEFSQKATRLANEVVAMRLEKMARDKGIDIDNENWGFDTQGFKFFMSIIEEEREPALKTIDVEPTIPSRKRGRPKKEEPIEVTVEEVQDEPELPFEVESK